MIHKKYVLFQFSADKRTQFESQVASSSTNTAIPGLTTLLAKKDAPPEAKRKMKIEFRNDVLKACSQPLKRFFKEKRISKVRAIINVLFYKNTNLSKLQCRSY